MVAQAFNFDCYDPTTYAVPGVPLSNTSCDNISFIDGLLPSSSAGELDIIHVYAAQYRHSKNPVLYILS